MTDRRYIMKKPCKECPFSRTVEPGTTGGSSPTVYVGQGHGPFWLPCHTHTDYEDPGWKTDLSKPQCAGAAMYRDLVGVAERLPDMLHKLEGDPELVFASPEELLQHHLQITPGQARALLMNRSVNELVQHEFDKVNSGREGQVHAEARR